MDNAKLFIVIIIYPQWWRFWRKPRVVTFKIL